MISLFLGLAALSLAVCGFRAEVGDGAWALVYRLFCISLACSGLIAVLAGLSSLLRKPDDAGPSL